MIRAMTADDIARAAEIQVFAWRTTDRGILSDKYLFNETSVAKRMDYFDALLKENADETYIFDDGIIKAFMTICACTDEDVTDAMQVSSIYVDPFFQRSGIGASLMAHCEQLAAQRKNKAV